MAGIGTLNHITMISIMIGTVVMNTEDPNRENIMILMTWIVIMKAAIVNIATVNLQGTKVSPEDDLTRMMTITEDHRKSITIAGVEDITLMTYMVWS